MRRQLNHLTRETLREWSIEDRRRTVFSITDLTQRRETIRAEQWARWKAEQEGVVIPDGAKMQFVHPTGSGEPMTAEFAFETIHSAWGEAHRGPRGGYRKPLYYLKRVEREVVALVPLPPHAQPVRDVLAWHAEHQANPTRDLIPTKNSS